jgi:hypothetical protein
MTHPIRAQIMGKSLSSTNDHKIEYLVKSIRNRIVANFDKETTAREFIRNQIACHGQQAPKLNVFRVTTITEKMN